ncbi:sulfotransferase family protein [Algivirga pacifica]|uniref:Sulfotransferase family protein n=1 Tax=Algivirga pacifica TaxID=1162670 RepID=A0ABP9DG30_9BACT
MKLEIIGSGLARTGTMSLKNALEELTQAPCYHMIELLKDPSRLSILQQGHKQGNTDWESFFSGFKSVVDYPGCLYVEDMLKLNPDLKVIHTSRDPEQWYESVLNTVYRGVPNGFSDILRMIKNSILYKDFRKVSPVFMFNDKIIWKGQFESKFQDKDFAIKVFLEHEEYIKRIVPKEQLLIYNINDGWGPLCDFLNTNVPDNSFPKSNQRVEFNEKMDELLIRGKFVE